MVVNQFWPRRLVKHPRLAVLVPRQLVPPSLVDLVSVGLIRSRTHVDGRPYGAGTTSPFALMRTGSTLKSTHLVDDATRM